jgi:hypothetical protein
MAIPSFTINGNTPINIEMQMDPHLFYAIQDGHALFTTRIEQGTVVGIGEQIPMSCMFQVYRLTQGDVKVGFYFVSQFHVVNSGGFLAAYMTRGIGKAIAVEVLLKTPDLVVYHYTNRGTLIVCPVIGDDVRVIFEEQ